MIRRWFKRMFLELLFDDTVRKEIIGAIEYQKTCRVPPPSNKYSSPSS